MKHQLYISLHFLQRERVISDQMGERGSFIKKTVDETGISNKTFWETVAEVFKTGKVIQVDAVGEAGETEPDTKIEDSNS